MIRESFATVNIAQCTPGDDWRVPIPLAGAVWLADDTARMHVRATPESPVVVIDLTTANGRIALNAGEILLTVPAITTATVAPGAYVWDMEITRAGIVETIIGGTLAVRRDVTR